MILTTTGLAPTVTITGLLWQDNNDLVLTHPESFDLHDHYDDEDISGVAAVIEAALVAGELTATRLGEPVLPGEVDNRTLATVAYVGVTNQQTGAIASLAELNINQARLRREGNIAKTVLAVGFCFFDTGEGPSADHKAQITSLGEGNVVFVYANGNDFTNNVIQEGPIFLGLGEVYVIENVQPGTIIEATEGAYGFSQQRDGGNVSPMPLMSLALAFKDTFFFGFRNSATNDAYVHLVAGAVGITVSLYDDTGAVVLGQEDVPLDAWEYGFFNTNGNGEYRIVSSDLVMACTNANMNNSKGGGAPGFYDSRLILPVTNDCMTWPRSGFMSAPYANTNVRWWVNDGAAWDQGTGAALTVSPGSPVDIDAALPAGTGANDADYEPRGATRFKAGGLVSAYSGADSAGLEATPACPLDLFTQRIAIPLRVRLAGDGGNNGIAIASPYEGRARLYQWNQVTGQADLVTVNDPTGNPTTDILIERRSGAVTVRDDQNYPASALISPQGGGGSDPEAHDLLGDFTGGYLEINVPCCVVFNSEQNELLTYRGTSGAAVAGIYSNDDEQLSFGITPDHIRAAIKEGEDGILYHCQLGPGGGTADWEIA